MSTPDSQQPPRPERPALPAQDHGGPPGTPEHATPRRGARPGDHDAPTAAPRRATVEDGTGRPDTRPSMVPGRWLWPGVAGLVLVGVVLWLVLQPTDDVTVVVRPPGPDAATSTATASSPNPTGQDPNTTPTPEVPDSAAPLPGTLSAAPVPSESPEPTPGGSVSAGAMALNDATFSAPDGWRLYADDLIEDGRRAVRLSQDATDVRLQAVTLLPDDADLTTSCTSLVDIQQAQFTGVSRQLVVPIGVDNTTGTGVRCGFMGVRASDGVANTVTFTLVRRSSDSHVLMLRTTVPDEVATDSPAVQQLAGMSCAASSSFGVTLPLC